MTNKNCCEMDRPTILMVVNDQGGGVIQFEKYEISPTIRTHMKHHEQIVVLKKNDSDNDERNEIL